MALCSSILQDTLATGAGLCGGNLPDGVNACLNGLQLLVWGLKLHFFDFSLGQDDVDLLLTLAVERVLAN